MIDRIAFKKLSKTYASYAIERRKLFANSDDLLAKSKQAIFALQRDDLKTAASVIAGVEKGLLTAGKIFKKHPDLAFEGPYRAALEEYAEAKLFFAFMMKKSIGRIREVTLDEDTVLGGLSDCVGEISRKCVQWASHGDWKRIPYAKETADDIVALLLGVNLTGHLRTKLDQAKQGLRRIEDVAYDISIHHGKK
jgi:translin